MAKSKYLLAALVILLAAASFPSPPAAASDLSSRDEVSDRVLVDEILKASAIEEDVERLRLQESLQQAIASVVGEFGGQRPAYRRARQLHRVLHRRHLRHYEPDADGLHGILEDGSFNCLSATLFYGLVARALGYRPQVVETPGHLFLRLRIGDRSVDVEATSPEGFDVTYHLLSPHATLVGDPVDLRRSARSLVEVRSEGPRDSLWPVPLEQAVGFAWLNAAWRSLQDGDALRAADSVLQAHRFLPDLATRARGVDYLVSRSFSVEYEAGRFENAYRIGLVGLTIYPAATSTRDRLLAAAVKRIEVLCEADAPAAGEAVLEGVARLAIPPADLARLERGTAPLIAAVAVRNADWELARRLAERYAAAEPDRVEAARLKTWIEYRSRAGSRPGEWVCQDPPLGVVYPSVPR